MRTAQDSYQSAYERNEYFFILLREVPDSIVGRISV